ncbi:MAG: hypothetical protein ACLQVI_39515 [Polyangiaceae bacterium]
MIEQRALTVVANVAADRAEQLLALLERSSSAVMAKLAGVSTLHFGRFVVFARANGMSALAFESNYDGDEDAHVAELVRCIGGELDAFFGLCEGYAPGTFPALVRSLPRSMRPRAFYVAHGGLSVEQIKTDQKVRNAVEAWLDADDKAGRLASRAPREIASALKGELARLGLKVGPIDRGLPKEPFAAIAFGLVIFGYAIVGWPAPLIARLFYEPRDRREAKENPPKIKSDLDPYVCSIMDSEDLSPQNGLTHIVPVKPGRFRRGVLTFVLSFVECARSLLCFRGNLDGIETIHFARWVLLDDGTLVFFSNYDGSWESYLGDFVDKAHWFLTGIWTNTKWFPKTSFLVFGGASAEVEFKQWARTFQVKNPIWYSAYPDLSVANVLQNARIRELAGRPLRTDREARGWLALV